jgi:hypothetical protein
MIQVQSRQFGDTLQRFQPIWQEYGIRFVDRSDRQWSQDIAMVVDDGDHFLTLLVFMAGITVQDKKSE